MSDFEKIPIIRIYSCLIVSIQVELSDRLVNRLKEDVTDEIERAPAAGLVIDVSGVGIMDSYLTRALCDLALMAKLMGVPTVISGIAPTIAMTLVEMDLKLEGVMTLLNLELGLEWLRAIPRRAAGEEFVEEDGEGDDPIANVRDLADRFRPTFGT